MKHLLKLCLLPLACCLLPSAAHADKLTDYSAASSLLSTDLLYVVTDPGGTPATHKATMGTLGAYLSASALTLSNKTLNLASNTLVCTSAQLMAACADETGTGSLVFGTSPDFTTGITINGVAVQTVSSASTLTNKSISLATNTLTFTSAQLATACSNEVGTGALVFGTLPDFTTGITVGSVAVPTISSTDTLTNKTLTSPVITTPTLTLDKTIIAPGTTGAATINKPAGRVNFAAAAAMVIVTDSQVTATSIIIGTVAGVDVTLKSVQVVAGSGSFTLTGNAAATAETPVNFIIFN